MTTIVSIIITSIIVFLIVVLVPVGVLVILKKRLTPQGKVKITINNERIIEVEPGDSLLTTLANQQIFYHRHVVVVALAACAGAG